MKNINTIYYLDALGPFAVAHVFVVAVAQNPEGVLAY